MRRSQTNRVAGSCCCLVPLLILLAIIVAAVIGAAVVWHAAMTDVFSWDSGHHHHYDVYRDGYEEGNRLGAAYARRGDPAPADLDALAIREADRLHVRRRDRDQWVEGFRNGFDRGFRSFTDAAFNESAGWLRKVRIKKDELRERTIADSGGRNADLPSVRAGLAVRLRRG